MVGVDVLRDDVAPVYSVAKVYTAAAALLCFDENDTIGALTDVPERLAHLRVGDLLAHRSGLGDYAAWPDYVAAVANREPAWPAQIVIDRAELAPPGTFRYSNIGYLLIRRALENSQRASFFDVIDRLVLSPLGVTAFPFETPADWQHCAPSTVPRVREYDPRWVYTGTFAARVDDVTAGLGRLMAGHLAEGIAQRMRRSLPVDAPGHPLPEPGYGLGLMTSGRPVQIVGHGGGGPGFTLFVASTADGSQAHGERSPTEIADGPLVAACLHAITGGQRPHRG